MIFKQLRLEPLGHASYLIGCMQTGEAAVIDPSEDLGVASYGLEAADLGLSITHVFETHVHADYVSAARTLAEENGAELHFHESARDSVRYDFSALSDGEAIEMGNVRIETIHTPGHTPEHASYIVIDKTRSEEPWCVLTGDSLLVADVGRPDLSLGGEIDPTTEERARGAIPKHHPQALGVGRYG